MVDQRSFFGRNERYTALSAAGNPLERLSTVVNFEVFRGDFEVFRGDFDAALARADRARGVGRPATRF